MTSVEQFEAVSYAEARGVTIFPVWRAGRYGLIIDNEPTEDFDMAFQRIENILDREGTDGVERDLRCLRGQL